MQLWYEGTVWSIRILKMQFLLWRSNLPSKTPNCNCNQTSIIHRRSSDLGSSGPSLQRAEQWQMLSQRLGLHSGRLPGVNVEPGHINIWVIWIKCCRRAWEQMRKVLLFLEQNLSPPGGGGRSAPGKARQTRRGVNTFQVKYWDVLSSSFGRTKWSVLSLWGDS